VAGSHLTGGRLLARNVFLNLVGQIAPMAVALVAIPLLIVGMGTERFGILALAWMGIGYFSLFDLGLGRSLTHLVAERVGAGRDRELPALIWTALALMGGLGLVALVGVWLLADPLVERVLNVPPELRAETRASIVLLAWSLPLVISTAGLRGVLEAVQRFGIVNAIRVPMGIFTFAGPLLVLPFTNQLPAVVAVLVAGRLIAWVVHLFFCLRTVPGLADRFALRRSEVPRLLGFGGWVTVSNVVSPLMVYIDRFVIGTVLTMTAVAYYVTPYEVVTKLWLVPTAVMGVFFPAFSSSFRQDAARTAALFDQALRAILLFVLPPVLAIVAFAPEALAVWVGPDFAQEGAIVARLLAVGLFINCLAHVPFAFLQGVGRPDIPAKLHCAEAVVFLPFLWLLITRYGIAGAAAAWSLRAGLDAVLLFLLAARHQPERTADLRIPLRGALAGLAMFAVAASLGDVWHRAGFTAVTLAAVTILGWRLMLRPEERRGILALLGRGG